MPHGMKSACLNFCSLSDVHLKQRVLTCFNSPPNPSPADFYKLTLSFSEGEPSHGQQEVGRVTDGKVVGEISLFEGGPRTATVKALTGGVILVLDIQSMNAMAEEHPKLAFILCRRILREVSAKLRQTTAKVFIS